MALGSGKCLIPCCSKRLREPVWGACTSLLKASPTPRLEAIKRPHLGYGSARACQFLLLTCPALIAMPVFLLGARVGRHDAAG